MGLIDIGNPLSEVVRGSSAIIDSFQSEYGLVGVLGHLRPASHGQYLLKLKNLALTHRRTCLPGPAFLEIFLVVDGGACDIWLIIMLFLK